MKVFTKIVVFIFLLVLLISIAFPSSAMVYSPVGAGDYQLYNQLDGLHFYRTYDDSTILESSYPAYVWDSIPFVYGNQGYDQTFRMNATYNGSNSYQQVVALRHWSEFDEGEYMSSYVIGGFNDTLATSYDNYLTITAQDVLFKSGYQLWDDGIDITINNLQDVADDCKYSVYAVYTWVDTVDDLGALLSYEYSASGRELADNGSITLDLLPGAGSIDPIYMYPDSIVSVSFTININVFTDSEYQKFNITIPTVFGTTQNPTLDQFVAPLQEYGYDLGYDTGYVLGYDTGYREGFYDGSAEGFDFVNFLKVTVGSFFQLQIMPNVTIGLIFSVIFIIILLMVFLHKFGGR